MTLLLIPLFLIGFYFLGKGMFLFMKSFGMFAYAGYLKWFASEEKLNRYQFKMEEKRGNPYIRAHQMKQKNDAAYDEYLQWLDRNGGDIPFNKYESREEREFKRKFDEASFKRWRPNK